MRFSVVEKTGAKFKVRQLKLLSQRGNAFPGFSGWGRLTTHFERTCIVDNARGKK
jgi:hypothetical protein